MELGAASPCIPALLRAEQTAALVFVWFCGALALPHRLWEEGGIQL